ncbi:MAG TPA: nicotinate-nucleotide adenylyltransferase [Verrucomicrobiae bacterium]|nr:nicotinate-nucleotide adenylyltransferase [Verrucomicrobiae bacterium]
MKFGIYGGSFNPVHLGHLLVAQAAIEELNLDRLFFVPAAKSPFKSGNEFAPGEIRLQLLRLALAGKTNCEVDPQEIRRGGVSYTIETLRDYKNRFPGDELFYLIGADNVSDLAKWQGANEMASLAEFVAVPRPGENVSEFPKPFRGRILDGVPVGISSSQIRERIKKNLTIENLVPPFVAGAIRDAKLYL